MQDRFEHEAGTLHDGCSLIHKKIFKGIKKLSPHRISPSVVPYNNFSDVSECFTDEDTAKLIDDAVDPKQREQLIRARIGQGQFRLEVLGLWGGCSVTNCLSPALLNASHIVPWREATNVERLDPFNGLLLSPSLYRLFDRHLISFDDFGKIVISKRVLKADLVCLNVTGRTKLRAIYPQQMAYLAKHIERMRELEESAKLN